MKYPCVKILLNEQDYAEYSRCVGEWSLPPELVLPQPVINERIYQILQNTVLPTPTETDFDQCHTWPLRIAIVGKRFSGIKILAIIARFFVYDKSRYGANHSISPS